MSYIWWDFSQHEAQYNHKVCVVLYRFIGYVVGTTIASYSRYYSTTERKQEKDKSRLSQPWVLSELGRDPAILLQYTLLYYSDQSTVGEREAEREKRDGLKALSLDALIESPSRRQGFSKYLIFIVLL